MYPLWNKGSVQLLPLLVKGKAAAADISRRRAVPIDERYSRVVRRVQFR